MTLSALNAPEGDVDIEGLGDSNTHKKLDFDSGVTLVECCDVSIFECIFEVHGNSKTAFRHCKYLTMYNRQVRERVEWIMSYFIL